MSKLNLLNEDQKEDIYVTVNTAIDVLKTIVREHYYHPELEWAKYSKFIMLTSHRRENLSEPMYQMFRTVKRIFDEYDDVKVIYSI